MNHISLKNSKKFKLISGDKNKIHIDKNYAKQFFLKETIVHGVNLALLGLIKFSKYFKKNRIKNLKIDFKNYCFTDEKFIIRLKSKSIIIKNKLNNKVIIELKNSSLKLNNLNQHNVLSEKIIKFYKLKKSKDYFNFDLINHLIKISRYIGNTSPGPGSLIHSITSKEIENINNSSDFAKTKKIIKNINFIKFSSDKYISEIISSRLVKIKFDKKKFKLPNNILKKIKYKKILFFGVSGDISKSIILSLKKASPKISDYSFKNKERMSNEDIYNLEKFLKRIKPDYIFYLCSPRIVNDQKGNRDLLKLYNDVYCKKFKIILDILHKNNIKTKIFYPSTIFLNSKKKYLRLNSYLKAKENAENICKKHPYSKFIKSFRLPKFKTRSNYNFLGFYEGIELYKIKKYLKLFF